MRCAAPRAALGENLGKPFIVDNRAARAGNLGGAAVAKASADATRCCSDAGADRAHQLMYRA